MTKNGNYGTDAVYRKGSDTCWWILEACGTDTDGVHLAVNAQGVFGILTLSGGYAGEWRWSPEAGYHTARTAFYRAMHLG